MGDERLRDIALRFAAYVQRAESPTYFVTGRAQNAAVGLQEVDAEERATFLASVLERFPAEEDPHHNTHAELQQTINAFVLGEIRKCEAYAKGVILLIGHADLLHLFERVLTYDAGKMPDWHFNIDVRFLRQINQTLARLRMTVEAIRAGPQYLTAGQVNSIKKVVFYDPVERAEFVAGLSLRGYQITVLGRLERRLEDLQRTREFVDLYCMQRFAVIFFTSVRVN